MNVSPGVARNSVLGHLNSNVRPFRRNGFFFLRESISPEFTRLLTSRPHRPELEEGLRRRRQRQRRFPAASAGCSPAQLPVPDHRRARHGRRRGEGLGRNRRGQGGKKVVFYYAANIIFCEKTKETVVEAFKVPTKNGSINGNRKTRTIAEK